jgi:hypothetical protein
MSSEILGNTVSKFQLVMKVHGVTDLVDLVLNRDRVYELKFLARGPFIHRSVRRIIPSQINILPPPQNVNLCSSRAFLPYFLPFLVHIPF